MNEKNINSLEINSLFVYDKKKKFNSYKKTGRFYNLPVDFDTEIKILKNGSKLNQEQLDKVIRLILREMMDMLLLNENFELKFGYDYYMYVKCNELSQSTIRFIEDTGLFVEPFKEQRKFMFYYKND